MYACHRSVEFKLYDVAESSTAHLGSFDVVVKVVSECLDVRDDVWHPLGRQVSWEKDLLQSAAVSKATQSHPLLTECHVANLAGAGILYPLHALQL